jgi:hypothetical protein
MEDLQHRLKIILLSSLILFVYSSCSQKQRYKNSVYIDVYGDFKQRVIVKIDDDIIFDKKVDTHHTLDVIRGPLLLDKEKVKIFFSIDNKDTSVIFNLKKNNYLYIGHSDLRHEFQFYPSDSIKFFHSRID